MLKTILAIDIGTTSLKASLISAFGEVVSFSSISLFGFNKSKFSLKWIKSFYKSLSILDNNLYESVEIIGCVISGNGPTIVTDSGWTLLWNKKIDLEKLEIRNINESLFLSRILYLQQKKKSLYDSAKYILSGPEFLIYKLTGNPITILPEDRFIKAYWTDELLKKNGIDSKKIPPFIKLGEICGFLDSKNISIKLRKIHFNEECKVIAGGPDFVVALIGTNTLYPGSFCDRCGSSEGFNYCSEKFVINENLRTLPSVISGLWNISYLIPNSGSLKLKEKINKIQQAKNNIWNIIHKNDLIVPKKMILTGGQANDSKLNTCKKNIFNIEVLKSEFNHSELIGDACIGFYALGYYDSLQDACIKMIKVSSIK